MTMDSESNAQARAQANKADKTAQTDVNAQMDAQYNNDSHADIELERLLTDAFDSPPMPQSLLHRIDREVEQHWGESPQLATTLQPAQRAARFGLVNRVWRTWGWTVALSLSMLAVLLVVLQDRSDAFGWPEVLDILQSQEVVEVQPPPGTQTTTAWMAMPIRVVAAKSERVSQLADFRRGKVMQHVKGAPSVQRATLPLDGHSSQVERMVLRLLLGAPKGKWRVLEEQWRRTERGSELTLRVADDEHSLRVMLQFAGNSKLPRAYSIGGGDTEAWQTSLGLAYISADTASRISDFFPTELAVQDASDLGQVVLNTFARGELGQPTFAQEGQQSSTVLAQSVTPNPNNPSNPAPSDVPNLAPAPDTDTKTPPGTPSAGDATSNNTRPSPQDTAPAPLTGAASLNWAPVKSVELADGEVIDKINLLLKEVWADYDIKPAPYATPAELMRRVYLDLLGRTPTVQEARAYLKTVEQAKTDDEVNAAYATLIDNLLKTQDHATHMATTWRRHLLPEGVDLTAFGGTQKFDRWLAQQFQANDPYSKIVEQLLLSEGRLVKSGPLLFYSAAKLDPEKLAARTARVFLGMRLDCAQCHDDPFEPWTQKDFWSYAAFFARISRPRGELETVSTAMRVHDIDRGDVMLPDTETIVPPGFLDGQPFVEQAKDSRRKQLTRWLVAPENPFFARAAANRVWAQLFGQGIVEPVDGFGKVNRPVSSEMLDLLAGQFVKNNFDMRKLLRTIVMTDAYRRSSQSAHDNKNGSEVEDDADAASERRRLFAQMNIKMLTAEQMYDCIVVATILPMAQQANMSRMDNPDRAAFLETFGTPGGIAVDYQGGIPQALAMMNGSLVESATGEESSGLLASLEAPFYTDRQRIDVLYLATLSRTPSDREWKIVERFLKGKSNDARRAALADVLWALLNSAEFTMNH